MKRFTFSMTEMINMHKLAAILLYSEQERDTRTRKKLHQDGRVVHKIICKVVHTYKIKQNKCCSTTALKSIILFYCSIYFTLFTHADSIIYAPSNKH